jgi:putative hemolysin
VKRALLALFVCMLLAMVAVVAPGRPVQAGNDGAIPPLANVLSDATDSNSNPDSSSDSNFKEMADYCVKKGGEVDTRIPYFNTNDDNQKNWTRLVGQRTFCKFTSKADGSRIHVLLTTLYTKAPSLGALAYYAKVPLGTSCNGNPASCYCSQLGGSDLFGGINANGGGWVQMSDPVDTVLEACIFPDMSTVDSWGLAYHSYGIVRGKNLEHVFRFPDPYTK